MDNVKIELSGDWAFLYPEMIHKTTRALQKLMISSLGIEGYQTLTENLRTAKTEDERKEIARKIPIEGEGEVILLNQVVEWSFGAVNQETIDRIPSSKYDRLQAEVEKLYSPAPLAVSS